MVEGERERERVLATVIDSEMVFIDTNGREQNNFLNGMVCNNAECT